MRGGSSVGSAINIAAKGSHRSEYLTDREERRKGKKPKYKARLKPGKKKGGIK